MQQKYLKVLPLVCLIVSVCVSSGWAKEDGDSPARDRFKYKGQFERYKKNHPDATKADFREFLQMRKRRQRLKQDQKVLPASDVKGNAKEPVEGSDFAKRKLERKKEQLRQYKNNNPGMSEAEIKARLKGKKKKRIEKRYEQYKGKNHSTIRKQKLKRQIKGSQR